MANAKTRARAPKAADEAARDGRVIRPEALERLRATIVEHFSRAEFHEVGIREICRHAGVGPQTVYKYFGTKEELLLACVEEDLARLGDEAVAAGERAGDDVRAILEAMFDVVFRFYAAHPAIARIVFLNLPTVYWIKRRSAGHGRFYDGVERLIVRGQRAGRIRRDAPPEVLRDWVAGGANRTLQRWTTEGGDPARLAKLSARLAWDLLRTRA